MEPADARTNESTFEMFLLRRHRGSSFMASAYVFPGGAAEPGEDARTAGARAVRGSRRVAREAEEARRAGHARSRGHGSDPRADPGGRACEGRARAGGPRVGDRRARAVVALDHAVDRGEALLGALLRRRAAGGTGAALRRDRDRRSNVGHAAASARACRRAAAATAAGPHVLGARAVLRSEPGVRGGTAARRGAASDHAEAGAGRATVLAPAVGPRVPGEGYG